MSALEVVLYILIGGAFTIWLIIEIIKLVKKKKHDKEN